MTGQAREPRGHGLGLAALIVVPIVVLTVGCASNGDGEVVPPPDGYGGAVRVGNATFNVEIVTEPADRVRGLSGRDRLPATTGMLFVPESRTPESRTVEAIWMKGMRFPLDLIWIGSKCTVVDLTLNAPVPVPGTPDADLPLYVPGAAAAYVLEVNAGEVRSSGVERGDDVSFPEGLDC